METTISRHQAPTAGGALKTALAMRRPGRPTVATSRDLAADPAPPSAAVIALNRLAFGPRHGDIAAFNDLGSTNAERLEAWVDEQLTPWSITDTACNSILDSAGMFTRTKSLAQLWADHVEGSADHYRPYYEVELETFIRAVHSERQLLEVMVDFWHNHFNVYAPDYWIAPVFRHYDRDVIRANALGNFRQMLEAAAKSPAMLYFLDNYTSTNSGPNENFARELFELHGLGAENYLGVQRQNQVPPGPGGEPIGYVDDDVYEATRAFTGWSYARYSSDPDPHGEFYYRAEDHDRFQKTVLGVFMPADQAPLKDGLDVLDAIAAHPGTGRHIARKIARRLVSDDPPQDMVDAAAAVFTANWDRWDQIKRTVREIVLHPAFLATWGQKVKRPFEIAISALRAVGAGAVPWVYDHPETNWFFARYDDCGHDLFRWRAPDGFPDTRDAWASTTPRAMAWRLCGYMIDWTDDSGNHFLKIVQLTPSNIRSATGMVDFWVQRILRRSIPAAERQALIDFMAAGFNPDFDLPVDSDVVFLRGGMDGLNVVMPIAGADRGHYETARPDLKVPVSGTGAAINLNGQLGLHPSMASLHELYQSNHLSIVVAAGLSEANRSHFEAQPPCAR